MMSNRHAMNWGVLLGLLFCLNFWVSTVMAISWLQFLIIPAEVYLVYRLARNCRDTVYDGYASYGQMLWYIVQLSMYSSLISALFKYLYCKVLNPDYLRKQIDMMMEVADSMPQLFPEMYDLETMLSELLSPLNLAVQCIWMNIMACFIMGLVIAAFVRREHSPFDNVPDRKDDTLANK
ncbi:MAG: DUF4199 domain-containing protein [Candidatus Aphodosoma sp.]